MKIDYVYATSDQELIDKFWSRVNIKSEDECWLYTGPEDKDGYGLFHPNSYSTIGAHRFALILKLGKLRYGRYALHIVTCLNRRCCNPKHLYSGTQKQNVEDAASLGKMIRIKFGDKNPNAKLTNTEVLEIKSLISKRIPEKVIAERYNVSRTTINNIKTGYSWSQI